MRRTVVKRAATSATMDEITFRGCLSSVVTTGGGVAAQQGHHNNNPKLDGVVHDLDIITRMTD
jgi:hypothetical protein